MSLGQRQGAAGVGRAFRGGASDGKQTRYLGMRGACGGPRKAAVPWVGGGGILA